MTHRFRHYLVSGLVVIAPLFFTVLVIRYLIRLADNFIVNPVFRTLPFDIAVGFRVFLAKLAIAVVVVVFVGLVGAMAERFLFRNLLSGLETVFGNIPIFNKLYVSFKEIAQAFFGDKSGVFKRVVFLEYPRQGLYALGFVTQEKPWELSDLTGKELVTVFVPSPPNPATGFFIFVPKKDLMETQITVEEGIRLVISGGGALPQPKK